jgi:hypothetical protein
MLIFKYSLCPSASSGWIQTLKLRVMGQYFYRHAMAMNDASKMLILLDNFSITVILAAAFKPLNLGS